MYIARVPNRQSRPAILLRESYREDGKVRTRTLANLTHWPPERIVAMERLVKGAFDDWSGEITSGEIFGVLFALKQLADQVGLTPVLGNAPEGKLTLFLILARIAHGGSRLSAVRWAPRRRRWWKARWAMCGCSKRPITARSRFPSRKGIARKSGRSIWLVMTRSKNRTSVTVLRLIPRIGCHGYARTIDTRRKRSKAILRS